MKKITRVLLITISTLLCGFPGVSRAQDAAEPAPTEVDCSRWTIKNLRLGMSVGAIKEQFPTMSPVTLDESFGLGGQAYRWQQREASRSTDFRIVADSDADDATVILINARIQSSGITAGQLQSALLEKWGGIAEIERDAPVAGQDTVSGRSVDAACDVRGEFSGSGNADDLRAEVTLFSIQAKQNWQMREQTREDDSAARDILE